MWWAVDPRRVLRAGSATFGMAYPYRDDRRGKPLLDAAPRAGPATWPSGVVPLARKTLASRVVKGARRAQGIRHLARGTRVRVVGEHAENFRYEVELEDG
jgi:hypothetical protein